MDPELYSRVRILTDRCSDQGVPAGTTGYVIEVFHDACEVEVSREDGTTIAILTLRHDEVESHR